MHLLKLLKHYLLSQNIKGHGVHSPFVYNFITNFLPTVRSNKKAFVATLISFYKYKHIAVVGNINLPENIASTVDCLNCNNINDIVNAQKTFDLIVIDSDVWIEKKEIDGCFKKLSHHGLLVFNNLQINTCLNKSFKCCKQSAACRLSLNLFHWGIVSSSLHFKAVHHYHIWY